MTSSRAIGPVTASDVENLSRSELSDLVAGKSIRRRRDMTPAERDEHDKMTARKRAARSRKRTQRDAERIARDTQPTDQRRLHYCWHAVALMPKVITRVVTGRYAKVRRVLGDTSVRDITQDVTVALAEGLARSDHRIEDLILASDWLSRQPGIPEVGFDDPASAKFIMSVLMNQARIQIANSYRNNVTTVQSWEWVAEEAKTPGEVTWKRALVKHDSTLESLEYLDTILSGPYLSGLDTLIEESKASRPVTLVGASFPKPGQGDHTFARMVVDAAISARGLDWLVDMFLDVDTVRSDGTFPWTAQADSLVTELLGVDPREIPEKMRPELAKKAVRAATDYLKGVVITAHALASDPAVLATITSGRHHSQSEWLASQVKAIVADDYCHHWSPEATNAQVLETLRIAESPTETLRVLYTVAADMIESLA